MQTKTKAPVTVGDVIAWFDERQDKRDAFLRANGLAAATLTPVGEDCAFRRYFRLHHNDRAMILMEAVPDNAEFVTPGHKLSDFIRIGTALRDTGVATPQVYAADAENGYVHSKILARHPLSKRWSRIWHAKMPMRWPRTY